MKIFSSALSSGWSFYARYLKCGRQMGWTPVPMNCCQWNTTLCTSTSQWISAYSQRSRKGEHQAGYRKWQHILFVVAAAAADGQHTAWKSTSVAQKKVSPHSILLVSWESHFVRQDWRWGLTWGQVLVFLCALSSGMCVSFLVWAGPVEGLELSLLKRKPCRYS